MLLTAVIAYLVVTIAIGLIAARGVEGGPWTSLFLLGNDLTISWMAERLGDLKVVICLPR